MRLKSTLGVLIVLALCLPEAPAEESEGARRFAEANRPYKAKEFDRAFELFREARAAFDREGNGRRAAETCFWMAQCLAGKGRLTEALELDRERLARLRKLHPGDHKAVVVAIADLAFREYSIGRPGVAVKSYRSALAMSARLTDPDPRTRTMFKNNLATCLLAMDRSDQALPILREVVSARRKLYSSTHPAIASSLNNLGVCLEKLGEPVEALAVHEEALAMRRRLFRKDHRDVATSLNNLGLCLQALGRLEEALARYRAALEMRERVFPAKHPAIATSLNNMGFGLSALGRHDEAVAYYRRALAICEKLYGDHPRRSSAMNNLATCLSRLGRYEQALALHEKVLAMRVRLYGQVSRHVALSLNNVGRTLARLGQQEAAFFRYCAAIAMAKRTGTPDVHLWITNLGWLELHHFRNPSKAAACFADAIERIEELRHGAKGLTESDRATYFERLRQADPYEGMVLALLRLGRVPMALEYLERGSARALLDLLERSRFDPIDEARRRAEERGDERTLAEIDAATAAVVKSEREVARLTREISLARGRRDLTRMQKGALVSETRAKLAKASEKSRQALRRRSNLVRDHVKLAAPADLGEVRSILRGSERILAYSISQSGSHVFVVPPMPGESKSFELAGPAGGPVTRDWVEGAVTKALNAVRDGASPGPELFRALVPDPVWKEIRDAPVIHLVPHGALHRLPFKALVLDAGKKPRYWLDKGPPISYVSSLSALLDSRRRRESAGADSRSAVLLGDPVFSRRSLAPLPGTRKEVESIRRILTDQVPGRPGWSVTTLLGKEATERGLFRKVSGAKILHLATHHVVDETELGSRSGLALTLPSTPAPDDDGFLRLSDLLERWRGRLEGCELVVLSACESQVGRMQKNEGMFAMPWGFLYAGAPSVIASLWRVDDASTAELMSAFYRRLRSGKTSRLLSFTRARAELKKTRPAPRYWAPFIFIGDPD